MKKIMLILICIIVVTVLGYFAFQKSPATPDNPSQPQQPVPADWKTFDSVRDGGWPQTFHFTISYPQQWHQATITSSTLLISTLADYDATSTEPTTYCRTIFKLDTASTSLPTVTYEDGYDRGRQRDACELQLKALAPTLKLDFTKRTPSSN